MEEDTDILETLGSGVVKAGYVLARQWDRVNERGSQALGKDEIANDCFRNSVLMYEASLACYIDKKFSAEKNDIMKHSEPYDEIATTDEFILLFAACNRLLKRKNLLPFESKDITEDGTDIPLDAEPNL